jgi:hypothetical protein
VIHREAVLGPQAVSLNRRRSQAEYFDHHLREGAHYANAVSYIEANVSDYASAARG